MPILAILLAALPPAATPAPPPPPITAEQAIATFEEEMVRARQPRCRSDEDPEAITVCGERLEAESPFRIAASTGVPGFRPPALSTQLFQLELGPVRIGCCALSTSNGTAAGLSISTRF